jgi:hypothetical protein
MVRDLLYIVQSLKVDHPPHAGPYKDTVNLPVTKFNMRANSVQREPELQRQWAQQRTYEQLRDGNAGVSVPSLSGLVTLTKFALQDEQYLTSHWDKHVLFNADILSLR